MKKDDLLKLAEIAGKEHRSDDDGAMYLNDPRYTNHWTIPWLPHEDLNQAMECLEALATEWDLFKTKDGLYNISILIGANPKDWQVFKGFDSLAIAICKAVLKAVRG